MLARWVLLKRRPYCCMLQTLPRNARHLVHGSSKNMTRTIQDLFYLGDTEGMPEVQTFDICSFQIESISDLDRL